jgi:hypothetical protein
MSSGTRKGRAALRMADGEGSKGNLPRGEPITTRRPKPNFERSNHLCSASLFPSTRAGGARAAKGNFSPLTSNQIVPLHPRSASCPYYIVSPGVQEIGHSFSPLRLLSRASGFVFVVEDDSTPIYHCTTTVLSSPAGLFVATFPLSTPFACCERVQKNKN